MKVLLGSNSPRRQELLSGLGIPYEVVHIDCDEHFTDGLQGEEIPRYIAREKAEAYHKFLRKDEVLITADTIVWIDGRMLGKPKDKDEAKQMLGMLSGHTHQVYTAICLRTDQQEEVLSDRTDVTFKNLTDEEIDEYVEKYLPLDKAGAYGVQEWIGYVAVERIDGSFYNVMGLPTHLLYEALKKQSNNPCRWK